MTKFVRLRDRNQITLPPEVTVELGLHENDFLAVEVTQTRRIQLTPSRLVAVGTPEADALRAEAEQDINAGHYETYSSGRELAETLLQRVRNPKGGTFKAEMETLEREKIREVLDKVHGDRQQAAKVLGVGRRALDQKLKKHKFKASG